ncbi:MAG: hypothetical protein GY795_48155, partial [Desulfobacterales bacterium]|nr:hypothetical protein [Desulfobacterales bacterium]
SDPEIFTAFVRDFLGIEIEIDKVETEKSFGPPVGKIDSRFDLYAEDKKNRVIVDIQHERLSDHYHRFMHYHCAALLEQAANSKNYRPGLSVFTLVVLTSGDKHKKDIAVTDFDPKDLKGNPLGEIPHKVIYICPKYVHDETPEPYREWMLAIKDSLNETVEESDYTRPEIRKVFQHIEKDRISPRERAKMFDEYVWEERDQEKMEEGKEIGIKEGKEIGIKEGKEVGMNEKAEQTARNLLSSGKLTLEEIAEATGLPSEKVRELSENK